MTRGHVKAAIIASAAHERSVGELYARACKRLGAVEARKVHLRLRVIVEGPLPWRVRRRRGAPHSGELK